MKTRGEEMLALRKARIAAAPPILRGGFRPFFFLGSVWAALALVLWIFAYLGALTLPAAFDALAWHRHEMLFGFIGAIVAGFLLTAIPNWTGRLPIAGGPLAALAGLWLAARIAVFWSDMSGLALAAALDVGFYFVFALVAGREVVAARNRNLPVVVLVLLLGLANAADYAGAAGLMGDTEAGYRAGIALVVMMITLIGGRIIPSFTRNWMVKAGISQGLPGQPDRFDRFAIAVTAAAMLAWVLSPRAYPVGFGLALAALVLLARLLRLEDAGRAHRGGAPCRLSVDPGRPAAAGVEHYRPGDPAHRRDPRADRGRHGDDDPRGDDPRDSGPHRARDQSRRRHRGDLPPRHARRAAAAGRADGLARLPGGDRGGGHGLGRCDAAICDRLWPDPVPGPPRRIGRAAENEGRKRGRKPRYSPRRAKRSDASATGRPDMSAGVE